MHDFLMSAKHLPRLVRLAVQGLQEESDGSQREDDKPLNKKVTCMTFLNFQFCFVKIVKILFKLKGASFYSLLVAKAASEYLH